MYLIGSVCFSNRSSSFVSKATVTRVVWVRLFPLAHSFSVCAFFLKKQHENMAGGNVCRWWFNNTLFPYYLSIRRSGYSSTDSNFDWWCHSFDWCMAARQKSLAFWGLHGTGSRTGLGRGRSGLKQSLIRGTLSPQLHPSHYKNRKGMTLIWFKPIPILVLGRKRVY